MYGADADTEQEYHETSDCSTLPFSVNVQLRTATISTVTPQAEALRMAQW